MAGTPSGAPRCALCGSPMREELGMERSHEGRVQRWWHCPNCCHRQTTIEPEGWESPADGEGSDSCTSM